ncbi:MAG: septum formation inhibitor Maf [Gammaproteobacteria bacterium]|uniref:Maf family protein n=1 Tax=Pseudomaricurvus alcaniphilus TaxID=1166482 RepID=UPI001408BDF1|nr:Maf family protein [Pseudomaricurvus alcaniphilus]MBR9910523.1 septum formation inhibitor Maf [Gammaproteobacteria bacterium]NHN39678.1 septum formation inhibitor Maf [Pseudomaricurvus alcaniphilus]
MFDLYLASQSPRRRELLQQIGVLHKVISVDVPEQQAPEESPAVYVQRLAREKAAAGRQLCLARGLPERPVLGADTVGEMDGKVLEKPRDRDHGIAMLQAMSGRQHRILTAVSICSGSGQDCLLAETLVTFGTIDKQAATRYWQTGEPADKAAGYAIQGLAAVFVEHIAGSYSAVVGLPLAQTRQLLEQHGVAYWRDPHTGILE